MGKMSLGSSGQKKPVEKHNPVVLEKFDDSQIKSDINSLSSRLSDLENREPQIIKELHTETVIEKQPEIHQHIHQDSTPVFNVSNLLPVDRYEAEFKMLNQTVNVLNESLEKVANNSAANIDELDQRVNELHEQQGNDIKQTIDLILSVKENSMSEADLLDAEISQLKLKTDKIDFNIAEIIKVHNMQQDKLVKFTANTNSKLIDFDLQNEIKIKNILFLENKLKNQKLINILLALWLVFSLFI